MIKFWRSLSGNGKFSIIAFFVVGVLGLLSMGGLGALLFYPISFIFDVPTLNDWRGDWVWPAIIGVGMFWSFGFILAGLSIKYLKKKFSSKIIQYLVYIFILWVWAAVLWGFVLSQQTF